MKLSLDWFNRFKKQIRKKKYLKFPKDWKTKLQSLYIIRKSDGICLYSHHFQLGLSQIEIQLVGMGFTALAKMMREIVDRSARLRMIDLCEKKVLIDERRRLLVVLVTLDDSNFLYEKLEELTDYFERMFDLQQQINQKSCVCLEDYALTAELVSLVFKDRPKQVLSIIPVIFKSIWKSNSDISSDKQNSFKLFNSSYDSPKENKINQKEEKRTITNKHWY